MAMVNFLVSPAGRVIRVIVGLVLMVLGVAMLDQTLGIVLVLVGLVPLLAGMLDFCVFARLLGLPFSGDKVREQLRQGG